VRYEVVKVHAKKSDARKGTSGDDRIFVSLVETGILPSTTAGQFIAMGRPLFFGLESSGVDESLELADRHRDFAQIGDR
jgi:hypothetical protein